MTQPAPGPATALATEVSAADGQTLLQVARQSIAHGLEQRAPLAVDPLLFTAALQPLRATFVTLELGSRLRGCIGTLEARRPLISDVAHNAFAAAFADPRFPALGEYELPLLEIHISVLSLPTPMSFRDEADLLQQIRPGVDGLILQDLGRRGTFLPAVWEQIRDPRTFLTHLKQKAGLLPTHWSPTVQVWRYQAQLIG